MGKYVVRFILALLCIVVFSSCYSRRKTIVTNEEYSGHKEVSQSSFKLHDKMQISDIVLNDSMWFDAIVIRKTYADEQGYSNGTPISEDSIHIKGGAKKKVDDNSIVHEELCLSDTVIDKEEYNGDKNSVSKVDTTTKPNYIAIAIVALFSISFLLFLRYGKGFFSSFIKTRIRNFLN